MGLQRPPHPRHASQGYRRNLNQMLYTLKNMAKCIKNFLYFIHLVCTKLYFLVKGQNVEKLNLNQMLYTIRKMAKCITNSLYLIHLVCTKLYF